MFSTEHLVKLIKECLFKQFLKTFKQGYAKYVTVDLHKICITFEQTQADATTKKAIYNVSSISTDNGQAK